MIGLSEEFAQPNQTKTSKVVGFMHGKSTLGSQKGAKQLRIKKGSQQHTNTPMITERVLRTLVSRLKEILKEFSDSMLLLG